MHEHETLIHPTSWKGPSQKFISMILHSPSPIGPQTLDSPGPIPNPTADFSVIDPSRMMRKESRGEKSTRRIVHAWRAWLNISATRCERSGILNWMLEGYGLYVTEGLEPPAAVESATGDYRDAQSKLTQFFNDECVTGDGLFVLKGLLYEAYKEWCKDTGVFSESMRKFGEKMIEMEYDPNQQERVNGKKQRVWKGVGPKDT